MYGLMLLLAKPLTSEVVNELVASELARLKSAGEVDEIILFGSAARGEMTDASDLDFVVVYSNEEERREGKKKYFQLTRGKKWPTDVLFVTRLDYEEKSQIGGVFLICKTEGVTIYRRSP